MLLQQQQRSLLPFVLPFDVVVVAPLLLLIIITVVVDVVQVQIAVVVGKDPAFAVEKNAAPLPVVGVVWLRLWPEEVAAAAAVVKVLAVLVFVSVSVPVPLVVTVLLLLLLLLLLVAVVVVVVLPSLEKSAAVENVDLKKTTVLVVVVAVPAFVPNAKPVIEFITVSLAVLVVHSVPVSSLLSILLLPLPPPPPPPPLLLQPRVVVVVVAVAVVLVLQWRNARGEPKSHVDGRQVTPDLTALLLPHGRRAHNEMEMEAILQGTVDT